jgi:hypothetical protein
LDHWIVIHWFELIALALLCLNLWFVFEVLKVLRAVKDCLMLLAGWLDKTRSESKREAGTEIVAGDDP